ncbi:MAG: hypothetical protein WKG01_13080 [Kofleriaceae bacterium]
MRPVAILGGGPYAARLCEVLASWPDMPALELRLHARDRARLDVIATHAARRVAGTHAVRACGELDDALTGAEVVVLLIRVGGMAARDHDERFPVRFGLVGDEGVGVGGMANAWRTLPVLDELAARISACTPHAHVLNLMAPLGVTTRLLVERGHRTVGLCELPAVTRRRWTEAAGDPAAPPVSYAGLNHLGFLWSAGTPAEDHPVLCAAVDSGAVPREIMRRFDAAPLHYLIDVFAAPGRRRVGRAGELAELHRGLIEEFSARPGAVIEAVDRRATPWFQHALAPALHAVLGGPAFVGTLDLPNAGRLAEVPAAVVIELDGCLTADDATLGSVPARPPAVRDMLASLATAEDALYHAARGRDRKLLEQAVDTLPLEVTSTDMRPLLEAICEQVA